MGPGFLFGFLLADQGLLSFRFGYFPDFVASISGLLEAESYLGCH